MEKKVGVTMENIKVERPTASKNSDFQDKLAVAKQEEALYQKGQAAFGKVLKKYDGVGLIGSHFWEYWHARATFFAEAGLQEVRSGQKRHEQKDKGKYKVLASRQSFLQTYELWMNQAIDCAKDGQDSLKEEKKQRLAELSEELERLTEFSQKSHKGLMDRPPTAWESLSGYLIALCLLAAIVLVVLGMW